LNTDLQEVLGASRIPAPVVSRRIKVVFEELERRMP